MKLYACTDEKRGGKWRGVAENPFFLIFSCSPCLFRLIRLFGVIGYSAEGKQNIKVSAFREKDTIIPEVNN